MPSFVQQVLDKKAQFPSRLLIVDKSVDEEDALAAAALKNVHVVKYDGTIHTTQELIDRIQSATGPFASIAFANHGPSQKQWKLTTDLSVDLSDLSAATSALAPLLQALVSSVKKTQMGEAHIDLLACSLAKECPKLIPTLEEMYKVDFRASLDETGNKSNWEMETDNSYNVAPDYFDPKGLKAYEGTMKGGGGARFLGQLAFHMATGGTFLGVGFF